MILPNDFVKERLVQLLPFDIYGRSRLFEFSFNSAEREWSEVRVLETIHSKTSKWHKRENWSSQKISAIVQSALFLYIET